MALTCLKTYEGVSFEVNQFLEFGKTGLYLRFGRYGSTKETVENIMYKEGMCSWHPFILYGKGIFISCLNRDFFL